MSGKKRVSRKPSVDPDDVPELDDEFFKRADVYAGGRLVRRGRPPSVVHKEPVTVRLDPDVVEFFRGTGPGWQTRLNGVLARYVRRQART